MESVNVGIVADSSSFLIFFLSHTWCICSVHSFTKYSLLVSRLLLVNESCTNKGTLQNSKVHGSPPLVQIFTERIRLTVHPVFPHEILLGGVQFKTKLYQTVEVLCARIYKHYTKTAFPQKIYIWRLLRCSYVVFMYLSHMTLKLVVLDFDYLIRSQRP